MKELDIDEKRLAPKAVGNAISMAKDELKVPEELSTSGDPRNRDIIEIYKLYQKRLMEYNAVDFDDIIMKTVELLQNEQDVRQYYQRKFRYVLVDEYQDTNLAQFELTRLLSDGYRNIMVVGDDDQSIYKFRGATIENILNFDKTYTDATVIKLEQNYRSTSNILNAANAIIKNNEDRHEKKLWCDKGEGEKITVHETEDQNAEGKYIIDKITGGIYKEHRKYSDFAVLYRINALGRSLQTTFAKSGIPYKVVGDMGFYDRKEVKDMLAYLSVLTSPSDDLRLKRIINEPKRKIGAATVDAIEEIARATGRSMYGVMCEAGIHTALAKSAEKLASFVALIESVKAEKTLPSELISELFYRSGYHEMLKAEGFEGESKI
jgi:DNA helicase-2/ATP-dependent DNA helicase PcrA